MSHDGNTVVSHSRCSLDIAKTVLILLMSKVTGSQDLSLRLWERTQEPLVLSEEREMVEQIILCHLRCIIFSKIVCRREKL